MGRKMKVYGVTGGAGTGKSEVMRMLKEQFGGFVILTDDVARELQQPGGISYEKMVERFGKGILDENGLIDRKKVAEIVFNDEHALLELNQMTHPYVRKTVEQLLDEAENSGYPFAAVESAILLDAGYEDLCDEFWYVHTDPEIRRARMKASRGYTDEKVDAVMNNQPDEKKFYDRCRFVIENNTSLEAVYEQLAAKLSPLCGSGARRP